MYGYILTSKKDGSLRHFHACFLSTVCPVCQTLALYLPLRQCGHVGNKGCNKGSGKRGLLAMGEKEPPCLSVCRWFITLHKAFSGMLGQILVGLKTSQVWWMSFVKLSFIEHNSIIRLHPKILGWKVLRVALQSQLFPPAKNF